MAHVTIRVGENIVDSVITRRSAEEMGLKKGDQRHRRGEGHRGDAVEGVVDCRVVISSRLKPI